MTVLSVAVETPRHTRVAGLLDYASEQPLAPGTLVRVPLGRRDVPGIVWPRPADAAPPPEGLRPVTAALASLPPLGETWRALVEFAAGYYQRGVGELALAVLPPELRKLDDTQLARRFKRLAGLPAPAAAPMPERPALSAGSAGSAAAGGASRVCRRFSRRASWVSSSLRSSGGSTASASSPTLRW